MPQQHFLKFSFSSVPTMKLVFTLISFAALVAVGCNSQSSSTPRTIIPLLFDLKRLSAKPGRATTVYENVKAGWYRLPAGVVATLNSSNYGGGVYPNKLRQTWRFYSEDCDFWLRCPCFKVQESRDCFKDYLRVYSNAFSEKEYCGHKEVSPNIPKGRRYLVLHFHTSQLVGDEGFKCAVGCGAPEPNVRMMKQDCPWNQPTEAPTTQPASKKEDESAIVGKMAPCECGALGPNEAEARRNGRVRGGYKVSPSEYPWVVGIFHENDEGQRIFRCAGTLISDRHVLTDFACIRHPLAANLIVAGAQDLSRAASAMNQWREVSSLRPLLGSNLALAILDSPLNLGPGLREMRHACLPDEIKIRMEASGSWGVLAGWGSAKNGNATDLQAAAVRLHLGSSCRNKLRPDVWVNDKEGCTEDLNDLGACKMDEGGPVMVQNGNKMVLVGVLRRPSCLGRPSVFSSLDGYVDELRNEIMQSSNVCGRS